MSRISEFFARNGGRRALVAEFRRDDTDTPVVLMGYLNSIIAMPDFAARAGAAGVDGLIMVNLPPEAANGSLSDLFKSTQGFVELRAIPGRSDIAFVEFDDELQAGMAMSQYQNYKIGEVATGMTISYAKK